ncbi:MAG: YncE family protein [Nitrosotalea sp.]
MTLKFRNHINLPGHNSGGFDHADVHISSGKVFVAHTANGTVEMIDGLKNHHLATIRGCQEASGILCAQDEDIVFAASRGAGKVMVMDANNGQILSELKTGPRPNGLAWDTMRKQLLVADVERLQAILFDPYSEDVLAMAMLPGRPRWCIYDQRSDLFLVNIQDPAGLVLLMPKNLDQKNFLPVSALGPHGLDLDATGHAFIACDAKKVILMDIRDGREISSVSIGGEPDVIWYNKSRRRLYCAIGKPGIIEVIDTKEFVISEGIKTEEGAHTLAFNSSKQILYTFLPKSCRVAVYEETG